MNLLCAYPALATAQRPSEEIRRRRMSTKQRAASLVLSMCTGALSANAKCLLDDPRLTEVRTIRALPIEVQAALGAAEVGLWGIAERDADFNRTDDVDANLPMRRFSVAGTSESCAVVAIERGGRGYWIEVLMFERADKEWKKHSLPSQRAAPRWLRDLVAAATE